MVASRRSGVSPRHLGLITYLPLALLLLAVAGAAHVVSAVFRNTILQLVRDSLRGRLSAVHTAVVGGGPRLVIWRLVPWRP